MNIAQIAEKINTLSKKYKMKDFQELRKKLHNLTRLTCNDIFSPRTVFEDKGIYAFHYGGRTEIQYNIGYEIESKSVRYGLAFSLEKGINLKDPVGTLRPKIERFNEHIRINRNKYSDMSMWHYQDGKRSDNRKVEPISDYLIKNGTFIFIGKYFAKQIEDITDEDLEELLQIFDRLLEIYKYVEEGNAIENKIARICWNDYGWKRPSGREGKSRHKRSYEHKVGYGHEEWLLDTEKLVDGYHHGYLQSVADAWEKYQGRVFNISLYSINSETGDRWWIGAINNAQIVSSDESKKVYTRYRKEGWFQEMVDQIKNVNGDKKDFLKNAPVAFTNIKFRPQDLQLLDPPQKILSSDKAIAATYYVLLNKTKDPELELSLGDDPDFNPGHTPRKEKGTVSYGQRKSEVDWFHFRMQNNVYRQLVKVYGQTNVRTERPIGSGQAVDLSVKEGDGEIFYEFKTSNSIRTCIREALAQLMEYSYYPDKDRAKKLIIVSQNPINKQAKEYLNKLRKQFNIPVYYKQYNINENCLEEAEY